MAVGRVVIAAMGHRWTLPLAVMLVPVRPTSAARLQSTKLTGVSANLLRNQPYLLTTGNVVPCILQTAMDSTLPGLVTCIIPQDVLGKTGLTLLDRGTRVVGQFQGGVKQGQSRVFVLWTRAETPQGVVINLDSPASDPLGRSGPVGRCRYPFLGAFWRCAAAERRRRRNQGRGRGRLEFRVVDQYPDRRH